MKNILLLILMTFAGCIYAQFGKMLNNKNFISKNYELKYPETWRLDTSKIM